MELVIIRHGLPLRVENKDNTPADPELSETGIEQARRLSEWLKNETLDASIHCGRWVLIKLLSKDTYQQSSGSIFKIREIAFFNSTI